MSDITIPLLVGALTGLPFILFYWIGRFVSRARAGAALREPHPWQQETLRDWSERGWLVDDAAPLLPPKLALTEVLYEWASVDADSVRRWRFRARVAAGAALEATVRDLWQGLPPEDRARSAALLREAVKAAGSWWGGAERGWTRRPFVVLASTVGRKDLALPLAPLDDLTAAPLPGPLDAERVAAEGDGADLLLALAALRRARPRFTHPLAPGQDGPSAMLSNLSTRVGSDMGSRIGAGIGAALGPIGSMLGRYLGEMAGTLGGKALAAQALPEGITAALGETEKALADLGGAAGTDAFARAVGRPAEAILDLGKRVEQAREARSRGLRERVWPSTGLAAVEEVLKVALSELQDYRAGGERFIRIARESPGAVAGGMILQNPWLVRDLPGAADRLNAARRALNRAAVAIRRH